MSLSIQTNVAALQAANNVNNAQTMAQNSIDQLSSGYRINSPADDAAGLGISEALESNIAEYSQAAQNITDGNSVVQVASSAVSEISQILTRLSTLAMEAANSDVNLSTSADGDVNTEVGDLVNELTRINNDSTYNGDSVFTPTTTGTAATYTFQIGIGSNPANDTVAFTTFGVDATTLGLSGIGTTTQLNTYTSAEAALGSINTAIQTLATNQATLGATSEQLTGAGNTVAAASTSTSAANAGLLDVNVATASTNLSQEQVLEQAGISVLAQANQAEQLALKLLS